MGALTVHPASAVDPAPVRRLAQRAACGAHHDDPGWLCEMGRDNADRVLGAVAAWLRDPTSGAAHTVQDAQREDATTNPWGSPLTRAQAVCDALAALLDGEGGHA